METRELRSLLEEWGCPASLTESMSRRWRARVAPVARTEDEILDHVTSGRPVLLGDERYASKAFRAIRSESEGCALDYFTGGKLDALPRPKIAFLGGWGAPGSDMASEQYLSLVSNFSDVVDPENDDPKNLQMFHRDQDENIPVLPRELEWPLPDLLGTSTSTSQADSDVGVVVDNATRLSQRGAVTWWHLDDGGEFVLQVGLPVKPRASFSASQPVKIFIFADKAHYKTIAQDAVCNKTGRAACLDIFGTPSEYLPQSGSSRNGSDVGDGDGDEGGDGVLPVFWVAPLMAGGFPLLSPPNSIHMVVTAQDCVMIEQRRISKVFLDECEYFMRRAKIWSTTPIFYPFIQEVLSSPERITTQIVVPLVTQAESYWRGGVTDAGKRKLARIVSSLRTLSNEDFFPPMNAESKEAVRGLEAKVESLGIDAAVIDPREAECAALAADMATEEEKVYFLGGLGVFFAMVHERGQPRWGPPRDTREAALKDRKKMKRASMERRLHECIVDLKKNAKN